MEDDEKFVMYLTLDMILAMVRGEPTWTHMDVISPAWKELDRMAQGKKTHGLRSSTSNQGQAEFRWRNYAVGETV